MPFDFTKAFGFVFEDHEWLPKGLIGAAVLLVGQAVRLLITFVMQFAVTMAVAGPLSRSGSAGGGTEWMLMALSGAGQLLGFLASLLATLIVWGYLMRLFQNVVASKELPMPHWGSWGEDFINGAKILLVLAVYALPLVVICGGVITALITAGASSNAGLEEILTAIGAVGACTVGLSLVLYFVFMPLPLMRLAGTGRISAAFELGAVVRLLTHNVGNYFLAILTTMMALFLAGFGIMLLCVGIFATRFWAYLITTHAFAQVYRSATITVE